MATARKPKEVNTEQRVAKKWTSAVADSGWTSFPNVIFEHQRALGLTSLDINILLHLAGNWWDADRYPFPSKQSLADAIGVNPRTVQRRIAEMEKWNYIKRIYRKTEAGDYKSNQYDLSGLVAALQPLAAAKIERRKQQQAEQNAAMKSKRPQGKTPPSLVAVT